MNYNQELAVSYEQEISLNCKESPFFYNSLLLFSDRDMEKIMRSRVGVAGLGGVGAIAAENLARSGIGSLKLADPDFYEEHNLNRQLFAIQSTLGKNKAAVACERLKMINPECEINIYEDGVHLSNVNDFCSGIDVLLCVPDKESAKIILHRVAKDLRVPVVFGSRSSIYDHRWKVKARIWNYKKDPSLQSFDETHHPEISSVPLSELTPDYLKFYDERVKHKKKKLFMEIVKTKPQFFGGINQQELMDRLENAEDFYNRHVCSVISSTGGCLAATAVLKVILGGPETDLEINLWGEDGLS
jgi:molybdopterin/thiamine biosynthesis adenylyltransferase